MITSLKGCDSQLLSVTLNAPLQPKNPAKYH